MKQRLSKSVLFVLCIIHASQANAQVSEDHLIKINNLLTNEGLRPVSRSDCLTDNQGTSCFVSASNILDWVPSYKCFLLFNQYDRVIASWTEDYIKSQVACR
jgi:hypothetical protein